jgi:uncharacterized membrane protein HdeD (DUF308 family)
MVVLARNWWLLALRGLVAVIFGVMTLFNPAASLAVLVLFFGAYAMVDGIFAIVAGATAPSGSRRWGWLIAGGVLGILVGIATLFMPQVTAFVLTVWIAVWAIFVGIAQIASAIRLRKEIEGEFWLILGGAVAVLFGIWALISPLAGAFAITFGIGFFAIVYGVTMLAVAFRLRGLHGRAAA